MGMWYSQNLMYIQCTVHVCMFGIDGQECRPAAAGRHGNFHVARRFRYQHIRGILRMVREARRVWSKDFTFDSILITQIRNDQGSIVRSKERKRRKMFDKNFPSTDIFPFVNGNLKRGRGGKKEKDGVYKKQQS